MNQEICNAINNLNLIRFYYEGGSRIIEPHCYGITTAGNEGLRAFQIEGYSSTGKSYDWKMFDLSKARNIVILDETFSSPRTGYKRKDRGMRQIFAEL